MDPTKYSANLLLQPVEWILSWCQKRPVAMFLDVSGRVAKMPDYKDLVAKVFGPAMGKVAAQSELFAERLSRRPSRPLRRPRPSPGHTSVRFNSG